MDGKGFCYTTVMITLVNLTLVSKYLTNLKRKCSFIVNLWPSVIYKFFLMPSGNGDVSYSLVTYESYFRLFYYFYQEVLLSPTCLRVQWGYVVTLWHGGGTLWLWTMPRMKIIFCDTSLLFKLTALVTLDTMAVEGLQSALSDETKYFCFVVGTININETIISSPNRHFLHLHSFQIPRFLLIIIDIKVEIEFNDS